MILIGHQLIKPLRKGKEKLVKYLFILLSNVEYEIKVFPGGSDSRFYRSSGLPAYGISPFRNTPILPHDHNEFLNSKVFLEGISVYVRLLEKLGNC